MSLGLDLLHHDESKDFELVLCDGERKVSVSMHRHILRLSSPYFYNNIGGRCFFFFVWRIPEKHMNSALRLLKYFYTRDLHDLGDVLETRTLCLKLQCGELFNMLRIHPAETIAEAPISDAVINHSDTSHTDTDTSKRSQYKRQDRDPPQTIRRQTRSLNAMITRSKDKRKRINGIWA